MKKICILLLLLCLALNFMGCGLFEPGVPGTTLPTSEGGNSKPCTHAELKTLTGYDATCTKTGLSEGKACASCGEIVQVQNVIEIKPHSFDTAEDKVCNLCGFLNSELPTFMISETKTSAGNKRVPVTLLVKKNPGIASIILSITYDDTALELTEIEYNTEIGGQTVYPQELQSPVTLYWINGFADTPGDWILATLYFDISESTTGEYDIQISYNPDNVYNIAEENLNFEVVYGKIVVD